MSERLKKYTFYSLLFLAGVVQGCRSHTYSINKVLAPEKSTELISAVCSLTNEQLCFSDSLVFYYTRNFYRSAADSMFSIQLWPFFERVKKGDTLYIAHATGPNCNAVLNYVLAFDRNEARFYYGGVNKSWQCYDAFESIEPLHISDSFLVAEIRRDPRLFDQLQTECKLDHSENEKLLSMIYISSGNLVVKSILAEVRPYHKNWKTLEDRDGTLYEWGKF